VVVPIRGRFFLVAAPGQTSRRSERARRSRSTFSDFIGDIKLRHKLSVQLIINLSCYVSIGRQFGMIHLKSIAIDLREPFDTIVAAVLRLPVGPDALAADDEYMVKAVRRLYETAHGRCVNTPIGLIPIAPAVASSLTSRPLDLATRTELLVLLKKPILLMQTGNGASGDVRLEQAKFTPPTINQTRKKRNLHVHITPHNVTLSPQVRDLIEKKISALSRFAGDVLSAEVVLRAPSGAAQLFSVSARLALPGRDVQANATHQNLYGAIGKLVTRLARLTRKRKTRFAKRFRPDKKHVRRRPDALPFLFAT